MTQTVAGWVPAAQQAAARAYLNSKYPGSAGPAIFSAGYCDMSANPPTHFAFQGDFPLVAEDDSGATLAQVMGGLADLSGGWAYIGSNPQGGSFYANANAMMAQHPAGPLVPYAPIV